MPLKAVQCIAMSLDLCWAGDGWMLEVAGGFRVSSWFPAAPWAEGEEIMRCTMFSMLPGKHLAVDTALKLFAEFPQSLMDCQSGCCWWKLGMLQNLRGRTGENWGEKLEKTGRKNWEKTLETLAKMACTKEMGNK